MLLVISSFLLQYVMVFVMELTKKISLPGKRKGKHICLSVTTLYRVYQSFLLLVIDSFSRYLFDDFCKRHNVHRKLAQKLDLTLVTMAGLTTHTYAACQLSSVSFSTSSLKLFTSFSYFKLRSHYRDGIKTLKEKCFNSEIFRRGHDVMV